MGRYLEILEDPGGELTIEDVSSEAYSGQFSPSKFDVPNFSFSDSAFWVRIDISNETQSIEDWMLEIGFANMHYVDLYTPKSEGDGYVVKEAGAMRPDSASGVAHPRLVMKAAIPPQEQQTIYLRLKSGAAMVIPLTLWTDGAFFEDAQQEMIVRGIYYGILIGVLFINLFLLISFREASYLWLVVFLSSSIIHMLYVYGYAGILIPFNTLFIKESIIVISFCIVIASMLLFTDIFLEIKSRYPILHTINMLFVAVWIGLILLSFFASYHTIASLVVPFAVPSIIAVLAAGIASWRQDPRPVRFFMIAWFVFAFGLITVVLVRLNLLPSTALTENIFRAGLLWASVWWTIALVDRINTMRKEIQETNLELQTSESRYRQLVETMNDSLGVIDPSGVLTYANKRMGDMLGYPTEALIGNCITDYLDDENQQILYNQLVDRKSGSATPYELTWLKKDGNSVITRVSPMPMYGDEGHYSGSFAVITDITDQKKAGHLLERRVAERTQELSTLLEISRDVVAAEDIDLLLRQILKRLNSIVNYHGAVIFAERKGAWWTIAQDWPGLYSAPGTLKLSTKQVVEIKQDFVNGDPQLINRNESSGANDAGFKSLTSRLLSKVNISCCWFGVPLSEQEEMTGLLVLACDVPGTIQDQSNVIVASANQAAIAIENHRLYQEIRESVMVDERNRLARELHDSVTQTLFTASVLAEATPRISKRNPELADQNMNKLSILIRGALAEMRSMLIELRAGDLGNQSLDRLINTLAEALQARTKANVSVTLMNMPKLPQNVTLSFYRITREALNNIQVHSGATLVFITLLEDDGRIELHIRDNGKGFNPEEVPTGHLGIKIMQERAAEINGELQIQSEPDHGTDINLTWSINPGEIIEDE